MALYFKQFSSIIQVEETVASKQFKTELLQSTEPEASFQPETSFNASSYFSGVDSQKAESVEFVPADLFGQVSAVDNQVQEFVVPQQQQQLEAKREDEALQQQQPSDDMAAWYQSELSR